MLKYEVLYKITYQGRCLALCSDDRAALYKVITLDGRDRKGALRNYLRLLLGRRSGGPCQKRLERQSLI